MGAEVYRVVTGGANHEIKALLGMEVARRGGYVTNARLGTLAGEMAVQADADWTPAVNKALDIFERSFEPAGLARRVRRPEGPGYELTPERLAASLAIQGAASAWSLRNRSGLSLQQFPGIGQVNAPVPGPQVRMEIVEQLRQHPGAGVQNLVGVSGELEMLPPRNVESITNNMIDDGLLTKDSTIADPLYKAANVTEATAVPARSDLTRAVQSFITSKGSSEFSFDECLDYVMPRVAQVSTDREVIRPQLRNRLNWLPGMAPRTGARQAKASFALAPGTAPALTSLLEVFGAIASGDPRAVWTGHQLARQIPASREHVRRLLNKANETSVYTGDRSAEGTNQMILGIVQGLQGPASSRAIASNTPLITATAHQKLKDLAAQGLIGMTPHGPGKPTDFFPLQQDPSKES
jgi:hypothetical protein